MKNFNKRLLYILESKDLSASQFATKIGVQRSSVSHVLSGRNKPSLDFLIKISNSFKDISIDWLVKGTTNNNSKHSNNDNFPLLGSVGSSSPLIHKSKKNIKEIILFYEDNSFKVYQN